MDIKTRGLRALCEVFFSKSGGLKSPIELEGFDTEIEDFVERVARGFFPFLHHRFLTALLMLFCIAVAKLPRSVIQKLNERSYLVRTLFNTIKLVTVFPYAAREEIKETLETKIETGKPKVPTPEMVRENIIEFEKIAEPKVEIECDVLVIGSGAGGAVVAKELAEKGLDVVVVERGFEHTSDEFNGEMTDTMPLLYRKGTGLITLPLPTPSFSLKPWVMLPVGDCLGGTTVINSSTCYRTPDSVLERWTEQGLEGLTPDDMKPYFERVERTISVHRVSLELMGEAHTRIAEGTERLGYSGRPLEKNALYCDATGVCQYGCPIDAKQDMHVTYIPLATQAGAKFYTGFEVQQIETCGGEVVKVGGAIRNRRGERIGKFVARARIFVLAAGAIYTPTLLLMNRIANSSGMVGQNLRIHPCLLVSGFFPEAVYGWRGVSQSYAIEEFFDEGFIMETTMVPPRLGALTSQLLGEEFCRIMEEWKKAGAIGVMINDSDSIGRVLPLSPFPYALPKLEVEALVLYRLGERDKRVAVKGVAEACRVLLAAGATKVCTGLVRKPWVRGEKDIQEILSVERKIKANEFIWSAYHPQCTCRMSVSPKHGVVDSYGQTHDLENLFIADASIFPECVRVNPQISIMAFANRCADHIWETRF